MSDNYYKLLGVEQTFDLDLKQLAENYLRLQQSLHPDRHLNESTPQKLLAANKLIEVSQAQQVLKSPFERGEYLLKLAGYEKPDESVTVKNSQLLMEQMELREHLSDLRAMDKPFDELEKFQQEVSKLNSKQVESISSLFAVFEKEKITKIAEQLIRLRFLDKLQQEIERFEEQLDDF